MGQEKIRKLCKDAKSAKEKIGKLKTSDKNESLRKMAELVLQNESKIISSNKQDISFGAKQNLSKAMLDRLLLTKERIKGIAQSLLEVSDLSDPVYEITRSHMTKDGLSIGQMRVPIGLIGIIYESRPNVTTEAASLCLKSSNVTILRGGSESYYTNQVLVEIMKEALRATKLPEEAINFIDSKERSDVMHLLKMDEYVDLIIPRGGDSLIKTVSKNSTIPVIKHDKGVCNLYIHSDADKTKAEDIAVNAKTQRPGVCNAIENLIIHKSYKYTNELFEKLLDSGVELKGCSRSQSLNKSIKAASEEDYYKEYLDMILSVKIVDTYEEALSFIRQYGSSHSDAIITEGYKAAKDFIEEVDSCAVYANASTRFTDGQQFGLGAEIGISTNKLHARGPMGLKELTTKKYIIYGDGQIRT